MNINVNQTVKIKLTKKGKQFLKERHKKLYENIKNPPKFRPIKEDSSGYSTWQLWVVMGTFGELMQYPTMNLPFESAIEVLENS